MIVKKKVLIALLALTILASSLGTYALANVLHPVNTQKYNSISGTFIDDSNTFSITSRINGGGLGVSPINITANATTALTAADLHFDTRITDNVFAGDYIIDLTLTNNTSVPTHATWVITFNLFVDGSSFGIPTSTSIHYLTTRNPVSPGDFMILTYNLGTQLTTPMSYLVTIQRV